ncbi:MAG: hypothetical protein ACE5F1_11215 [Planctomycetota bacterium]
MSHRDYQKRLDSDYRKTFKTPAGKHVLMDLYVHFGQRSTFVPDNPHLSVFNEGCRFPYLHIQAKLNRTDLDDREERVSYLAERRREEAS